jgi:hypothetical protein
MTRLVFKDDRVDVLHVCYNTDFTAKVDGKLVGDFQASLVKKLESGSEFVDASETVTFNGEHEFGGTDGGQYEFYFTPDASGVYELHIANLAAGTTGMVSRYMFDVRTSGALFAADYADAFCSEADIQGVTALEIGSGSTPSDTVVVVFARLIAGELRALMHKIDLGITPDAGTNPVDTTSLIGYTLRDMLRLCNATGVGVMQVDAAFRGVSPERSQKAVDLEERYTKLKEVLSELGASYHEYSTVDTPYEDGEIAQPEVAETAEASGIKFPIEEDVF